jgi:putative hemolysin
MNDETGRFEARLAETAEEVAAVQHLRYRVFVEELGACVTDGDRERAVERDAFDAHCDHLILIDHHQTSARARDRVVGGYRLLRGEIAASGPGFYGSGEYDLTRLARCAGRSVELGRSCVAPEYRGGVAMLLLWNALAGYVSQHGIEILFGVASFPGRDPGAIAEALSNLHHFHRAPSALRVRARPELFQDMNLVPRDKVDVRRAMTMTPPLIRAYLRHGGVVGDGAVIDRGFNTVDVCLLMETARMTARYRNFYNVATAQVA